MAGVDKVAIDAAGQRGFGQAGADRRGDFATVTGCANSRFEPSGNQS